MERDMTRMTTRAAKLAAAHRAVDERLQWIPGALPLRIVKRLICESSADLWEKCQGGPPDNPATIVAQQHLFCEIMAEQIRLATGRRVGIEFLGD